MQHRDQSHQTALFNHAEAHAELFLATSFPSKRDIEKS